MHTSECYRSQIYISYTVFHRAGCLIIRDTLMNITVKFSCSEVPKRRWDEMNTSRIQQEILGSVSAG